VTPALAEDQPYHDIARCRRVARDDVDHDHCQPVVFSSRMQGTNNLLLSEECPLRILTCSERSHYIRATALQSQTDQ